MSVVVKIEDLFTEAAGEGNIKELATLIEQGARINDTDKEGYAALQVAAKKGRDECVAFLLQEGANVNQRDSDGFSALHEAAFWGHDNVARILLRYGADKTFINSEGTTALELATMVDSGDEDTSAAASTSWRYCLHIAYYGTGFVGWQRQQQEAKSSLGHDSVQEVVEKAVTETLGAPQRVNVTGVSRTDAGTHALYQYGFIRLDSELHMTMEELKDHVNAKLGSGRVVVLGVTVPTTGPARIRSRYKKYIYYLQQGHRPDLDLGKYSWFLGRRLDIQRIRDALKHLEGTHDFRPFSQGLLKPKFEDLTTLRTIISAKVVVRRNVNFSLDPQVCGSGDVIDAADMYKDPPSDASAEAHNSDGTKAVATGEHKKRKIEQAKGGAPVHFVCIELVANGFLRHMVRRIIGTLRPIGEGTQPPSRMQQVLAGEVQPGPSAPTKALWLHRTWLTQEEYDADCAAEK
ncbi:tRNA pseudouridine(38-40) synthase [Phytophthora cinnamomi]|uniref:tRNA pseudouridine(38-40) synthase n=1 Tax=Phytophthora cinnamomi TaxID=4785 RepID=UPI0035594D7A|nr:tRNA pseudouridine(38-40) synthase [Phytophthora cinnamomi]